jgi:flagellar basal-body rod protein FlgB
MATDDAGLVGLLVRKLDYLNQKQKIHAENVANASTPGYRALEIAPFTFDSALKQASANMMVTDPRHIIPASMAGVNAATVRVKSYDSSLDRNSVDPEQEMQKSSQTAMEYNLITSVLKKITGLFRIALKGS